MEEYDQTQNSLLGEVDKYQNAITSISSISGLPSFSPRTVLVNHNDTRSKELMRGESRNNSPIGSLFRESKSQTRLATNNFEKNYETKKSNLKSLLRASNNSG